METYLPQVFKCCLFNIHLRYWSYWHSWYADGECSLLRLAPQCLYLPSYRQQISNIAAGFNLLTLLQNRMVHFTSKMMSCISMLLTVRHGFIINKRCPLYILNGHCSSSLNLQSFMEPWPQCMELPFTKRRYTVICTCTPPQQQVYYWLLCNCQNHPCSLTTIVVTKMATMVMGA